MNILYMQGLRGRTLEPVDENMPATGMQYVGYTTPDGAWVIQRIDPSVTDVRSYRYATNSNNTGYSVYSTAWTNRASLTYDYFHLVKV